MAKVNTEEIAEETGLPIKEVEKVVDQIIIDMNNHKRQPKIPPPEGGISIRAAERKYGILHSTLSRWASKGYITVLLRTRNEVYIEESQLSKRVNQYKLSPGKGKSTIRRIFNNI